MGGTQCPKVEISSFPQVELHSLEYLQQFWTNPNMIFLGKVYPIIISLYSRKRLGIKASHIGLLWIIFNEIIPYNHIIINHQLKV
jgi:hypothetical protein